MILEGVGHFIEYQLDLTERVKYEIGGLYQYNVLKLLSIEEARKTYMMQANLQADIFKDQDGKELVTLYRTILTKFPQSAGDQHPGFQKPVSRVHATDARVLQNLASHRRENMKEGLVSFEKKVLSNKKTVIHTKKKPLLSSGQKKFTFNDFSDEEDKPPVLTSQELPHKALFSSEKKQNRPAEQNLKRFEKFEAAKPPLLPTFKAGNKENAAPAPLNLEDMTRKVENEEPFRPQQKQEAFKPASHKFTNQKVKAQGKKDMGLFGKIKFNEDLDT